MSSKHTSRFNPAPALSITAGKVQNRSEKAAVKTERQVASSPRADVHVSALGEDCHRSDSSEASDARESGGESPGPHEMRNVGWRKIGEAA